MANKIPRGYLRQEPSQGFTLLEILVVLVLLSMVMTMLMQGLSLIYELRGRILVQIDQQRVILLREHLLSDLISGITPDAPQDDAVFAGDENGFYGLSLQSLQGDVGVPGVVRLWVVSSKQNQQNCLLYQQDAYPEVEMGCWQNRDIRFTFIDEHGVRYDEWPLANSNLPQLPSAVALQVGEGEMASGWFLPIRARTHPRATVQDIFE